MANYLQENTNIIVLSLTFYRSMKHALSGNIAYVNSREKMKETKSISGVLLPQLLWRTDKRPAHTVRLSIKSVDRTAQSPALIVVEPLPRHRKPICLMLKPSNTLKENDLLVSGKFLLEINWLHVTNPFPRQKNWSLIPMNSTFHPCLPLCQPINSWLLAISGPKKTDCKSF